MITINISGRRANGRIETFTVLVENEAAFAREIERVARERRFVAWHRESTVYSRASR